MDRGFGLDEVFLGGVERIGVVFVVVISKDPMFRTVVVVRDIDLSGLTTRFDEVTGEFLCEAGGCTTVTSGTAVYEYLFDVAIRLAFQFIVRDTVKLLTRGGGHRVAALDAYS